MNLDPDLKLILQVGAKIYDTAAEKQGKVIAVSKYTVSVVYGHSTQGVTQDYPLQDFKDLLVADVIVAGYRLTMGRGNKFIVKPRTTSAGVITPTASATPTSEPVPSNEVMDSEVGYIDIKLGKFSTKPKKGYIKIKYTVVTEKVTLDLTSEQIEKLKEMGIL